MIRRARIADAEAIFSLVRDFSPTAAPDRQAFQTTFTSVSEADGSELCVAENDGGLVVGYILVSRAPSFLANAPVAWVEEVMVAESSRRNKIGKALMIAAENWAIQIGATHIALASRQSGPFYLALGYEDAATFFKKTLNSQRTEGTVAFPVPRTIPL